jgi:hypothetical protein
MEQNFGAVYEAGNHFVKSERNRLSYRYDNTKEGLKQSKNGQSFSKTAGS